MINKVVLVGRLTKDIDLRKTSSNLSTCTFTLACNRRYSSNQQNGPTADFINCVAWRQSADYLAQYASKGSIVGVEGRITTRNYEGQNGKVYVTEVTCDNVTLIGSNRSNNKHLHQVASLLIQRMISMKNSQTHHHLIFLVMIYHFINREEGSYGF